MKFALSVLVEWHSPNFQTVQPLEIWFIVALALALGFGVKLRRRASRCCCSWCI